MSQIDKIHFFPTLFWVMCGYIVWYLFIMLFFVPKYYKSLRSRFFLEYTLFCKINDILISMELKKRFFFTWSNVILRLFRLKNNLFLYKQYLSFLKK